MELFDEQPGLTREITAEELEALYNNGQPIFFPREADWKKKVKKWLKRLKKALLHGR